MFWDRYNGGYILAAYGLTLLIVVGLIAWIVLDGRRQRQHLKDLEARGIRRRSDRRALKQSDGVSG
jgi:heme exporter protein D